MKRFTSSHSSTHLFHFVRVANNYKFIIYILTGYQGQDGNIWVNWKDQLLHEVFLHESFFQILLNVLNIYSYNNVTLI